MNIRPLSPAVSTYAGQNRNKTSENPSFGMFRPRLDNPVVNFVRRHAQLNIGWDSAVGNVYLAQKNNPRYDIIARVHSGNNPIRTIAFDIVDNSDKRRVVNSIVAQAPDEENNLVNALYSASTDATQRQADSLAEAAKKAAAKADHGAASQGKNHKSKNRKNKGGRLEANV